jgi:flagellar biogenesis protein FliO
VSATPLAENHGAASAAIEASQLPLRTDDPVSLALIIKVMLITALLLAAVYLVLRWYAKRGNLGGLPGQQAQLHCTAALRLSARTKVYLLKTPSAELLVAESLTGTTVTVLPPQPAGMPSLQQVPLPAEQP